MSCTERQRLEQEAAVGLVGKAHGERVDIVRRCLIDVAVKPVGVDEPGIAAPYRAGLCRGVVPV